MANSKLTKWMAKMQELEGALTLRRNVHDTVLRSPSPSTNFTFGYGHGLPLGFSAVMWGLGGSGKSFLLNSMIGQMHKDNPDAVAIKFDTEMREEAQVTPELAKSLGIDLNRYLVFQTKSPELIFNRIKNEIAAMAEEQQIGLIAIDSVNQIQGRRAQKQGDVGVTNIGDKAATVKEGLDLILPVVRKYRIATILCCHATAELDPIQQMRHKYIKMAAGNGVQHFAEYYMYVQKNESKDGRVDLLDNALKDETQKDIAGNAQQTGHKVRVTMQKSSFGVVGRVGEFTLDYNKGIINTHEELFLLAKNRGIIQNNGPSYIFEGTKWVGKAGLLDAIKTDTKLANQLWMAIVKSDKGDGILENAVDTDP